MASDEHSRQAYLEEFVFPTFPKRSLAVDVAAAIMKRYREKGDAELAPYFEPDEEPDKDLDEDIDCDD